MPERRIALDGVAVGGGKVEEGRAELGELGVEVVDVGVGDGVREVGEGSVGEALSVECGQANAAESVHFEMMKVRERGGITLRVIATHSYA